MATAFDSFIAALTAETSPADADELYIRDDSGSASKRLTWAQLVAAIAAVTAASTDTLTNKTMQDSSNDIGANDLIIDVRNDSGGTLTAGTPVYITGFNGGQDRITVDAADATSTATMPAIGLLAADLANNTNGLAISAGRITDLDTSSYTVGNRLYVSETAGTLTTTRPTGTAQVQSVAEVVRVNVSTGALDVEMSRTYKTGFAAALLTDGTAAAARTSLGLGTAATTASTAYATAAQGTLADSALQLRTVNAQTGTTYTLVLADAEKIVTCNNASAVTLTVPLNSSVAFPTGTEIPIHGIGAGIVTVAATGGVTVNGTPSLVFRAQYSAALLVKLGTDTWQLVGDLETP